MSEGQALLGFVIALAVCLAIVIAQILVRIFSTIDPAAAF